MRKKLKVDNYFFFLFPSLPTLWQYALRFRIEELFLDSKSGGFQLEESKIRHPRALERLYLV
ncbi:MAG: hypothetical protein QNJ53_08765, partial [Pleurocapsa sp. MO_192.B19]|nr:hypothetical protein [Pleurocapsa sp. MO_192.B19]